MKNCWTPLWASHTHPPCVRRLAIFVGVWNSHDTYQCRMNGVHCQFNSHESIFSHTECHLNFFYSIFHAAIELIDGSAVHTALSVASYDTFWVCHCGMIAGHRAHNVRFTHTQWLLLMICTFWYSPMCPTKYCDWQPLWQLWLHIENTNIICHAILWSAIPIVWYVVICRSPCAAQNPSNNTRFWYASSESEFNAKWY